MVCYLPASVTKYLRKSTYKEERFIVTRGFRGSSSWSVDSLVFEPVIEHNIMAGACGGAQLLT